MILFGETAEICMQDLKKFVKWFSVPKILENHDAKVAKSVKILSILYFTDKMVFIVDSMRNCGSSVILLWLFLCSTWNILVAIGRGVESYSTVAISGIGCVSLDALTASVATVE